MRVTRQRVAVLDAVETTPHASASAVLAAVSRALPGVSHQAVYDCLAHLTDAGLLRRFMPDGEPALYETRTDDNHHHFVCRQCGFVADVDCAVGLAPCLAASNACMFVIDEADVIYRGLCAVCAGLPIADDTPAINQPQESKHG